jgi:eukaryotic-like serine/threonine-protein kinase
MGVVYRALDSKLKRRVALKVLHPSVATDEDRRKRFIREGRLVAHLTHPNIATVYDVGEADDRVYIAMELVEGEPLSSMIKPGRHVSLIEAMRIMHEVVRGLSKAHEMGVMHRDLKPDNIMVGNDGIVKILDFGVAKRLDNFKLDFTDIKTQHGSLVGTPAYMSPEQAAGKSGVDSRSDIFSVGVVLFELLTRCRPFQGETWQETIISINRDQPPPVSQLRGDVPKDLDAIVARCLAKKPDARYASCRELNDDLEAAMVGLSTGTFPPGSATGILARASALRPLRPGDAAATLPVDTRHSDAPPVSGERIPLAAPSQPTTGPVARSMDEPLVPERRRSPWAIIGGIAAVGLLIGGLSYGLGEGPAPQPATRAPEGEPTASDPPEPSSEPDAAATASAPDVEASASPEPSGTPSATAVPSPKPIPKPPKAGPAPPRPTAKPKNPVLGF